MANVTIYTLAKELNMTVSMVSRAFNPEGKINEEKRKLVLETAKKYSFHPNKFASRLSMRTIKIGIFINSRFNVSCDKMLAAIKAAHELLRDYKIEYNTTVFKSNEKDIAEYEEALFKYADYDGIIVAGLSSEKYTPLLEKLYKVNKNIVQVQSINNEAECLFVSKHNEKTASRLAAEFLYNSLRFSENKNVVLFTGDRESAVHSAAKKHFVNACYDFGLNVVDCMDMKDNNECLKKIAHEAFEKYDIKGAYITSGVSDALCEYLEENSIDIPFVTFDTHSKVKEYMKKGIVSATISQDIFMQMQQAYDMLVKYIISGEKCDKTIYTDVQLILKSNIEQRK